MKPVISLEELIELGLLNKHQARNEVIALLRDDHTVSLLEQAEREKLANDPVFLDNIVFSEIYIKTPDFPHDALTKIIESKAFIKSFEGEVNAARNMVAENILEDIPKDIGQDAEKKFAPDFLKSLEEKCGKKIGGLALLEGADHRTGTKPLFLI